MFISDTYFYLCEVCGFYINIVYDFMISVLYSMHFINILRAPRLWEESDRFYRKFGNFTDLGFAPLHFNEFTLMISRFL